MKTYTFKKNDNPTISYTPMTTRHWQRTIPASFKTDDVKEDMMQDEYNIKIGSALINNFEKFIDWLFFKGYSMSDTAMNRKFPVANQQRDGENSVSHEIGRATLIFTSDTNSKKLTEYCNAANGENKWNELYFVPMFGLNDYNNSVAENLISYHLQCHNDKHVVIFAKQIGARSFSVPQVDNVCVMINDPSFSSAVQKMCRNQTWDSSNPNKVANTYWFALNNLATPVQPLFELIHEMREYAEANSFNRRFIDTVDVFLEQDGEMMGWQKFLDAGIDPFTEYMRTMSNTFYRLSESFNLVTKPEDRQRIYELFKILKDMHIDLSNIRTSKIASESDKRDAAKVAKIFEGHSKEAIDNNEVVNSEKCEKEAIDFTMHVKNIIIDVCVRYSKHKYQNFYQFYMDFEESTNNQLTAEMKDVLEKIYAELLRINLIQRNS